MSRPISATLTRDRFGAPLVVLESEPFNRLEIYPRHLREMAHRLDALAAMAERLPTGGKHFAPTKVVLGGGVQSGNTNGANDE